MNRDIVASRVYIFLLDMQLPYQDVVVKTTKNKEQLTEVIVNKIKMDKVKIRNTITVTGKDPIPFKVTNECIEDQTDLKTNEEEVDTIFIHQIAAIGPGKAVVFSYDTDVFVLLLHYIYTGDIKANVLMQPTSADSDKVIDVAATYHKHFSIMPNILTAHALSGFVTVGNYFGIGKPIVLKALKNNAMLLTLRQKGSILIYPTTNKQKLTALWKQEGRFGNIMYLKIHISTKIGKSSSNK